MSIFLTDIGLNKQGVMVLAMPSFSFLAWYYIFSRELLKFIVDTSTETFTIYNASFNFLLSFTIILGASFIHRFDKTSVIYAWSTLSSLGTVFLVLIPTSVFRLIIYLLLGVVFGMCLLAFFTYFWDSTAPEERGRVAGLIGFVFLPVLSLVSFLAGKLDFFGAGVLCIILSLVPLTIKALNTKKITTLTVKTGPKGHNPEKRTILFYLIPWIVSSLINATLAKAISFHTSQYISSSLTLLVTVQIIGGGLGAIISGVVADFFGRRPTLAFGLTLFGINSAISGFSKSYEILFLSFIGTGMTWGFLLTLYLFVIWGDLADVKTCASRYSIGLATFYLATGLGTLFSPLIPEVPLAVASNISSLLIFLSNVPLILTPETLPLDFREKIRLKFYIYLVERKKPKHLSDHG